MFTVRRTLLALAVAVVAMPASAAPVVIDFESLGDVEAITTQFQSQGATFASSLALVSGVALGSLNELDFPPNSGVVVASDDGGPIEITFSAATTSGGVKGYFTYVTALTMTAFDAGNLVLATVSSSFADNTATLSGNPPNELLAIALAGITRIVIAGDAQGGSFTLDDLEFELQQSIPEPTSMTLLLLGLGWMGRRTARGLRH